MRHIKTHETVMSHVALVANTPRKIYSMKTLYEKKNDATKLKTLQKKEES